MTTPWRCVQHAEKANETVAWQEQSSMFAVRGGAIVFSGGKSRLDILWCVNGIQFSDKPLLRHSQT